jgi:hypothetical protein
MPRLVCVVVTVACLAVLGAIAASAAAPAPKLRVGGQEVDYASAMSPAGEYAKALAEPEAFSPDQRLTFKGVIVEAHGKPVAGLTVRLFPLDDEGPGLILGLVGEEFGIANPAAATDAAGAFIVTTGPLGSFTGSVTLGLLHPRAADRPFDVGVLPLTGAGGMLKLTVDGEQREFDLGTITLVVAEPAPQ